MGHLGTTSCECANINVQLNTSRRLTRRNWAGFSAFPHNPAHVRAVLMSSGTCYRMRRSQWPRSFSFLFFLPRSEACTMKRVAASGRGPPPPPEDAPCGTRCSQWAFRSCYRCLATPTAGFFTQWAVYCPHNKKGKQIGLCSA